MKIKALSVRQPWAWALIHGGKDVENRSWRTNYRGPLAIHASLRFDKEFLGVWAYRDIAMAEVKFVWADTHKVTEVLPASDHHLVAALEASHESI